VTQPTITYPELDADWSKWLKNQWVTLTEDQTAPAQREKIFKKLWNDKKFQESQYYKRLFYQYRQDQELLNRQKEFVEHLVRDEVEEEYLERHPEPKPNPVQNSRFYQAVKNSLFSLEPYAQAFLGYLWADTIMSVGHGMGVLLNETLELHNQECDEVLLTDKMLTKLRYLELFEKQALPQEAQKTFEHFYGNKFGNLWTDLPLDVRKIYQTEVEHELASLRLRYPEESEYQSAIKISLLAQKFSLAFDELPSLEEKVNFSCKIIDKLRNTIELQPGVSFDNLKAQFKEERLGKQVLIDADLNRGSFAARVLRERHNNFLPAYNLACKKVKPLSTLGSYVHPSLDQFSKYCNPLAQAIKGSAVHWAEHAYSYVMGNDEQAGQTPDHYKNEASKRKKIAVPA
jgi:hypothetical protein